METTTTVKVPAVEKGNKKRKKKKSLKTDISKMRKISDYFPIVGDGCRKTNH